MSARLQAAAEGLLLVAIVLAPWPYGGATDPARYGLTAVVLLAVALFALARALAGEGLPFLVVPATALSALGLAQIAVGASAARSWTGPVGRTFAVISATVPRRDGDRPLARRGGPARG